MKCSSTGTFAFSACGGTNTVNCISVPVDSLWCLYIKLFPPNCFTDFICLQAILAMLTISWHQQKKVAVAASSAMVAVHLPDTIHGWKRFNNTLLHFVLPSWQGVASVILWLLLSVGSQPRAAECIAENFEVCENVTSLQQCQACVTNNNKDCDGREDGASNAGSNCYNSSLEAAVLCNSWIFPLVNALGLDPGSCFGNLPRPIKSCLWYTCSHPARWLAQSLGAPRLFLLWTTFGWVYMCLHHIG